jgi:archaellum component FlaC
MTIDERIEALTMNLELAHRDIMDLKSAAATLHATAQQDGENIRALARIAEMHERRLTQLEGGE